MRSTEVERLCEVPRLSQYGEYREYLRIDFTYTCAFCGLTERKGEGVSFEIDHFMPQYHGGKGEYQNLLYVCRQCNRRKSKYWDPNMPLVRPDKDSPREHFSSNGEYLNPLTDRAGKTLQILGLNDRSESIKFRRARRIKFAAANKLQNQASALRRKARRMLRVNAKNNRSAAMALFALSETATRRADEILSSLKEPAFSQYLGQATVPSEFAINKRTESPSLITDS